MLPHVVRVLICLCVYKLVCAHVHAAAHGYILGTSEASYVFVCSRHAAQEGYAYTSESCIIIDMQPRKGISCGCPSEDGSVPPV